MSSNQFPDPTPTPKKMAFVFWGICLLAPLPGLVLYISWLWELEQYGFVLPALATVPILVAFRWDRVVRMPSHWISVVLLLLGLIVTGIAYYTESPWLASVGFVLTGTAWLHSHLSESADRQRLTYISLLLLMLIRLPLNYDLKLTAFLQRFTSRVSSHFLDWLDITHYLRGNVIDLPSGTLFVEEACSGVQSLFTMLFLTGLLIVVLRRPLVTTPFYIIAGIGWAMVMNVLRITSIAVAQEWYGTDLSKGLPHEILGWICLLLAVGLMASTDRFLRVCFEPIPRTESQRFGNPAIRLWNQLLTYGTPQEAISDEAPEFLKRIQSGSLVGPFKYAILAIALALGIPSIALGTKALAENFVTLPEEDVQRDVLWAPPENLFATTRWKSSVVDYDKLRGANSKQLGANADTWSIAIDGIPVRVAVSQPYPEWHDMCLCYTGNGWQLNEFVKQSSDSDTPAGAWTISRAEFVRDKGTYGHLLFCGIDSSGKPLIPPADNIQGVWAERFKDRKSLTHKNVMLQLWVESETALLPAQVQKVRGMFKDFQVAVIQAFDADQ